MAFKILARRDLAQEDLRRIIGVHEAAASAKAATSTPEKAKRKKRIGSHVNSSVGSAASSEQVAIDFDQFCCIVSEFKNGSGAQNNNNYATKEAVTALQGSAAKKCKTERKSRGSC